MQNFQDTFETCKQSFISAFSISMTALGLIFNIQVQKGLTLNINDLLIRNFEYTV